MASTTSKLLNIGKNPALQSLIHSNILLAAAATPIPQVLGSTAESQVSIQFGREGRNVKTSAPTAAEILKTNPVRLGFTLGLTGFPGSDQSERILRSNPRPSKVEDEDDEMEDNLDEDSFVEDSDGISDDSDDGFGDSDYSSGSDSD